MTQGTLDTTPSPPVGRWVCINPLVIDRYGDDEKVEPYTRHKLDDLDVGRDYELFGYLAQVRSQQPDGYEARGFPDDASKEVTTEFKRWNGDAHTPSHLSFAELEAIFGKTVRVSGMMPKARKAMIDAMLAPPDVSAPRLESRFSGILEGSNESVHAETRTGGRTGVFDPKNAEFCRAPVVDKPEWKPKIDWDVLYPYCGMTTDRDSVEFEYDVPAAYMFRHFRDDVMKLLRWHSSEKEHSDVRIVFWFDN